MTVAVAAAVDVVVSTVAAVAIERLHKLHLEDS